MKNCRSPKKSAVNFISAQTNDNRASRKADPSRLKPTESPLDADILKTAPRSRSIMALANRRLSPATIKLLHELGETGDELGVSVYAVGGFVRDLILKKENLDLDVAVEGDGIFFAKHFAKIFGGKVRCHPAFGAAAIVMPDGGKLDIASARQERYEYPGALPTIEPSSLELDLRRRDFTINALALCLNRHKFAIMIDFFGGRQDIRQRSVRALHNLSFIEDPTRIFRAIRFERRLGFPIEPRTERLMRDAIKMGVIENIGAIRLRNELIHILNERKPSGALQRMSDFALLSLIHPSLKLSPKTKRIINKTSKLIDWFGALYPNEQLEQWTTYFLAFCEELAHEEFEETCQRLKLSYKMAARVFSSRRNALMLLKTLEQRIKQSPKTCNSEVYNAFQKTPLEVLLYIAAKSNNDQARKLVTLYIVNLRQVRIELGGNAIKKMGLESGPLFNILIKSLTDARLDGEVASLEEERAFAVKFIEAQKQKLL